MGWAAKLWSLALVAFVVTGSVGAYAYVDGAWHYRGFPPPLLPARLAMPGHPGQFVRVSPGTLQAIGVASPALDGHAARMLVLLPPGYASHPGQR